MTDFIEMRILGAVRALLSDAVNAALGDCEIAVPLVEFDGSGSGVVSPVVSLAACERSEKERIVLLDAYTLHLTFSFADVPESEMFCYAYAAAVRKALEDDPALGGVAERAVLAGKKYVQPKTAHCGEGWAVTLSLRVTTSINN